MQLSKIVLGLILIFGLIFISVGIEEGFSIDFPGVYYIGIMLLAGYINAQVLEADS